ncbi:MAG TPA: hypothetical protein GXZ96_05040 [Firmicutes bacterium]|nr:hypothetical protein [Bacillota bacterium]
MIIYTPVPLEQVLWQAGNEQQKTCSYRGRWVIVARQNGEHRWRLVRLLSTDPQDFLDAQWAPGQIVELPLQ